MSAAAGFESNMVNVYTSPAPVQIFNPGWQYFAFTTEYNWDTTQNLIVEICYSFNDSVVPNNICLNPGGAAPLMKYSQTTYTSALLYAPFKFDPTLNPPAEAPDPTPMSVCGTLKPTDIKEKKTRPAFKFTTCEAPTLPFSVKWTPGDMLSDSTIFQPLAYVSKSVIYKLETYGRSGCILRDSVDVFVPTHNFKVGPIDTAICLGETAPMFIQNGTHFIWHEYDAKNNKYLDGRTSLSCTDCANPIAKPNKTTIYKVEVADSVWCFDTLTVTVIVKPLPQVHILNQDTIIKYGKPIQLLVNGARMYNWTPVSSLNNPNISYPIGTPTEPTLYVVTGIGANGCSATDTLRVGIDYRDKLFIPSAFSPNGDGKNDVFRVTNLTFQRVMEFRVFNRWGQEIFRTTNSETGWDGTWKNVAQDMGDYQYIIRVGYPDGLVETYKGDVTLIR
jgi:gliding motility-associated-like protein